MMVAVDNPDTTLAYPFVRILSYLTRVIDVLMLYKGCATTIPWLYYIGAMAVPRLYYIGTTPEPLQYHHSIRTAPQLNLNRILTLS